jgi:hypothetical protein
VIRIAGYIISYSKLDRSGNLIIVRLNGGLGNQLFQYAAGFSLARITGTDLKLDLSVFSTSSSLRQTFRNPDILDYCISARIATAEEVGRLRNPLGSLSEIWRLFLQKGCKRYYPDWHPEVMNMKGDVYLDGYFQCEKYFSGCLEGLVNEFSLRPDKVVDILPMSERILRMQNSVSLHVRRGDYIRNPQHEICTVDYFQVALSTVAAEVGQHQAVVFSDDVAWVRANLDLDPDALLVSDERKPDGTNFTPAEELTLMSKCRHHIISNSTFSWWGAYLNMNPRKIVIAPSVWNRSRIYPHKNILPVSWQRIAVP